MREHSGLLTDLYELTMAAGYLQTGFEARATFELFVRHLPPRRNYLVAAGLEQALEFLENVQFTPDEIGYLRQHRVFRHIREEFFEYLAKFRFTGDVWAMPEGTLVFPGEPMLRVTAPIIEGQIMETYLLATLSYQTMIASKAARVVTAARGRQVVDFGARRAHGSQASVLAARAAAIGGCAGTSNVLAGREFGMNTYGTQAHSWVMAHEEESEAFRSFLDAFPEDSVLLLDTYDVRSAVKKIVAMGRKPAGVRLDSGELARESRWVRRELDRAGWKDVKVFASGDLDESKIAALLRKGAAIDAFGVGTALATPGDAPHLNLIYKLVEVERGGKVREAAKLTRAKATYPGRKQVLRYSNPAGEIVGDKIALEGEPGNGGVPLLVEVMHGGRRVTPAEPVSALRERCLAGLARLPQRYRQINRAGVYPVRYSPQLDRLLDNVRRRVRSSATKGPAVKMGPKAGWKPMATRRLVFWAVDVQADFMLPGGKLYVPGAEKLIPNMQRLVAAAVEAGALVVSSGDFHPEHDPEFETFPPHCLRGTPGARILPEAMAKNFRTIANDASQQLPDDILQCPQIIFEKQTLDVFDNPHAGELVERLGSDAEYVVFGVVTEYCVRCAAKGLVERGRKVAVVTDAIEALKPEDGRRALDELQALGVRLITTEDALAAVRAAAANRRTHSLRN